MASSSEGNPLRVFFVPFFAPGHMIPMADLACLFAGCAAVEPTLLLTPSNAALLLPMLDRSAAAGRHVRVLHYPFPDVGLPPGVENLAVATAADSWRIYQAVDLARDIHDELLRRHRPDAVVADIPFWWTTAIAAELGIPRITFHAVGVFPQLVMNNLFEIRSETKNLGAEAPVIVPNFPGPPIKIPRSELPEFLYNDDHVSENWPRMKESQLNSFGVVVNSFYDLEPAYCDLYRKVDAKRAWFVGPLALASTVAGNADMAAVAERGAAAGEESSESLKWLDKKEKGSVLFVCFGSWCHLSTDQLKEIANGLENSGWAFAWVIRGTKDEAAWMAEGWEERVAARGLLLRGWAPQVAILSHPAVGAFISHCGWNSLLEAATAGVPVLTWPLVFEQFINERLAVEVAGVGRRVWEGAPRDAKEGEDKVVVPADAIARAVSRFMEAAAAAGGEGERKRAGELAVAARAAVAEGGSSYGDLHGLVDELMAARPGRQLQN